MTTGDHAPWGVASASRRLQDGLGADGAVPKAVVDEGDDPSCHGDAGDLASTGAVAAVGGDANKVGSQLGPIRLALRRLDRCPANKTRSLFSDRAPMHRQVRLAVLWGEPRPARQLGRGSEPRDVAYLGHEHRGEQRADTWDLLDRLVTGMAAKLLAKITLELCDLTVEDLDQVPERLDADAIGGGEVTGLKSSVPEAPNKSVIGT